MLPKINHQELPEWISLAVATEENLLLVGAPGIGKTVGIKKFAEVNKYNLILSHPAVWEPTDTKGLPAKTTMEIEVPILIESSEHDDMDIDDLDRLLDGFEETTTEVVKTEKKTIDVATFLPFDDILRVLTATEPTIWFLDDLGQTPPSVQSALMQYLEGGELEGKKIPDCVHIVAATNGREHKAGVKGLLEPVKSRFSYIAELIPELGSFNDYILSKGYDTAIPDYMNGKPDALIAKEFNLGMENSPCPRLWEKLGKSLTKIEDWNSNFCRKVCMSTLGESTGREFFAFLKIYNVLPRYEEIVSEPEDYPLDQAPDVRFAMLGMLASKAKKDHSIQIFKFITRLAKEYQIVFVRTLNSMESDLVATPSMRSWMADNADIYMQALASGNSDLI